MTSGSFPQKKKKKKGKHNKTPPKHSLEFLFSSIQVQKRLRDAVRQHTVLVHKGTAVYVTLDLWYLTALNR